MDDVASKSPMSHRNETKQNKGNSSSLKRQQKQDTRGIASKLAAWDDEMTMMGHD
jgi:hypothetical protein